MSRIEALNARTLLVVAVLPWVLAGCSPGKRADQPVPGARPGEPVLRVLYRDPAGVMLLTLPARIGEKTPPSDCAVPLLIDPASGAARALSPDEVAARLRSMRLAGAIPGACGTIPGVTG